MSIPVNIDLGVPSETQKQFLKCKARYVAFGGARGGGKSHVIRLKAFLLCVNNPGITCCIVRRTYEALRQNHISELVAMSQGIARYNKQEKTLYFKNGSKIIFNFFKDENSLDKAQGQQCDCLFIDEATQFSEEFFDKLKVIVRGTNNFIKRTYISCNPGGIGHSWVKRLFISRQYKTSENPEDYVFIKSLVTDNFALMESDPTYKQQLESLPPKLRKAWLEGSFDILEGMFFEEFVDDPDHYKDRKFTHVIDPFEIPSSWKIYRSFDWGYSRPFDCSWWAVDYEGRAYLILQLYGVKKDINGTVLANEGVKWDADKVFAEIHRIEHEHRWLKGKQIFGVADPAIWAVDGGEAIIEAADRHQVHFYKADHQRIPGWMQVHYRMRFDEEDKPMIYFFNTCENAIRTIPLMIFDEVKVEDLDSSLEDHFCDSMRYFCMSRAISPTTFIPPEDRVLSPLDDPKHYKQFHY